MSDHNVVLIVAAYASDRAARRDFQTVVGARDSWKHRDVALSVLDKGPDGALSIDRSAGLEPDGTLPGALLAAALTVLAAPVGIKVLPHVVTAPIGWALVAALVRHYWQNVPQNMLRLMGEMLERGPVGVVIVAADLSGEAVRVFLAEASAMLLHDSTTEGIDVDLDRAIDEATGG